MPENQYMQPFFDSLSQGVQVAQHLRQAALQQQQLDRARQEFQSNLALKQQEQDLQTRLSQASLLQNGAEQVNPGGTTTEPALPTPNPLGGIVPGQDLNTPPPAGSTTQVPAPASRTVNVGGSPFYIPTQDEQTQTAVNRKNALEQGTEPTAGQIFGSELPSGADPNVRVPNASSVLAGRAYAQGMRQQQPAPAPKLVGHQITTDDKGNQTLVRSWDDGTVQETPLTGKGKTDKFGNPEATAATAGARALTANGQMTAANQTMNNFHNFESQEMQLRQQLDRIDTAIRTDGKYTLKVDGKGVSSLQRVDATKDPDSKTIVADLQSQRTNVGNRLQQVLTNKYDAGDQYSTITTGRPSVWGMSKQRALSDLQQRLNPGTPAQQPGAPAAAAPASPAAAPPPAAPPKALQKPGVITTFKNGQKWHLDANGNPAQVQAQPASAQGS